MQASQPWRTQSESISFHIPFALLGIVQWQAPLDSDLNWRPKLRWSWQSASSVLI